MNPLYPAVAARAENRCEYCRAPEEVFNFTFEVEHIQPHSLGGNESTDNLALACESCNLFKSDVIVAWDEVEQQHVSLFNPRHDRWNDHFRFDQEAGAIQGMTATGRATITRLRRNSPFQLRARQHWVRLGLYP